MGAECVVEQAPSESYVCEKYSFESAAGVFGLILFLSTFAIAHIHFL